MQKTTNNYLVCEKKNLPSLKNAGLSFLKEVNRYKISIEREL